MNDFTTNNTHYKTNNTTGRNIAIGATVASVVALLGIGSAVVLGGGDTSAAPAADSPTPAPIVVDAVAEVPVATNAPAERAAAPVVTPVVTLTADTAVPSVSSTPVAESAPVVDTPAPVAAPAPTNEGPCPTYNETNNLPLQLCDTGDWVSDVQYLLAPFTPVVADGYFGPQTEDAVKFMQTVWGFEANGIVTQELIDVIAKIDPSCNADGSMCEPYTHAEPDEYVGEGPHGTQGYDPDDTDPDDWHGEEFEGEGPHGDHLDGSYDDYCIDILFDAQHAPGQVTVDSVEIANCEAWLAL